MEIERTLNVCNKELKDVIFNELKNLYGFKLRSGLLLMKDNRVDFSAVHVNPTHGYLHLLDSDEKQLYVYNFGFSELKNIQISIKDMIIGKSRIKRIERTDTNEILELMYR